MDCRVFYESWQMVCCGEPFEIGDTVNWTVCECKQLAAKQTVDLGKIEYWFENHLFDHGPYYELEGKVTSILIMYEKFESSKTEPSLNVPVSGTLREVFEIERIEKDYKGMEATGYIVTLSDIKIEPVLSRLKRNT